MSGLKGKWALKFIDRIYDQLSQLDGQKEGIAAPELYVGILLLFNNINKYSPGKWVNPPKKSQVMKMLDNFDYNHDKVLNRQEFRDFCAVFFPDITKKVVRDLVTTFIIIPALIFFVVTHLPFIKKILPEAVIGAVLVSFLQITGFLRVLDDWLDRMFPGALASPQYPPPQPGVAYAYPYGAPPGTPYPYPPPPGYPAYPAGPIPAGATSSAPVPGTPAPPGTVPGVPAKPGVAVPSKAQ